MQHMNIAEQYKVIRENEAELRRMKHQEELMRLVSRYAASAAEVASLGFLIGAGMAGALAVEASKQGKVLACQVCGQPARPCSVLCEKCY